MFWHYRSQAGERGPISDDEIINRIQAEEIRADDRVRQDGQDAWLPAGEVFAGFFPPAKAVAGPDAQDASGPERLQSADGGRQEVRRRNYVGRHWHGELGLGVSYWINGLLGNLALMAAIYAVAAAIGRLQSNLGALIYWVVVYLFALAVVVWQSTGIWRSANRHVALTQRRFWARLAQVMVVLAVVRFAFDFVGTGWPAIRESLAHANWLAENARWEITLLREGREVEIRGGIGYGIADDFERTLQGAPGVRMVHVNLEVGGLVAEGERLHEIIRRRGLTTYVSSQCVSACAIVFLGGRERLLKRGARLGFHAYKMPGVKDESQLREAGKRLIMASGVTGEFADRVFRTPHDSMWFPEVAELRRHRVITASVSGDEFALSGFRRADLFADFDAQLTANPLYAAIRDREPELFGEIVGKMKDALSAGRSLDEVRPIVNPYTARLLAKYLPYGDEGAVVDLAAYVADVSRALRGSPAICLAYLRDGDPAATNAAVRLYPPGMARREVEVTAAVIRGADLGRRPLAPAEKQQAIELAVHRVAELRGPQFSLAALARPAPNAGDWCEAFVALHEAIVRLPPAQARAAIIGLRE